MSKSDCSDTERLLPHLRERSRERRADSAATDVQLRRYLCLGQSQEVVRDDDRALPLGQEREELARFETLEQLEQIALAPTLPDAPEE